MQPKQKRTFGILFPWSALWLMVCQFRALGSLHSNCQGYKARGSSECRVTDVPEGWVKKKKQKKKTVYVWYVLGASKIRLQVELLVPAFLYSPQKQLCSFNKACTNSKRNSKQNAVRCFCVCQGQNESAFCLKTQPPCFHNTIIPSCTAVPFSSNRVHQSGHS